MLNTTSNTLISLAALVWYTGVVFLIAKSGALFLEALKGRADQLFILKVFRFFEKSYQRSNCMKKYDDLMQIFRLKEKMKKECSEWEWIKIGFQYFFVLATPASGHCRSVPLPQCSRN